VAMILLLKDLLYSVLLASLGFAGHWSKNDE